MMPPHGTAAISPYQLQAAQAAVMVHHAAAVAAQALGVPVPAGVPGPSGVVGAPSPLTPHQPTTSSAIISGPPTSTLAQQHQQQQQQHQQQQHQQHQQQSSAQQSHPTPTAGDIELILQQQQHHQQQNLSMAVLQLSYIFKILFPGMPVSSSNCSYLNIFPKF